MAKSISNEILGIGWHFPVRVDARRADEDAAPDRGRGGIALSRHANDIAQSIRIILSTAKGERRMRPTFGCDIHSLVFAPSDATTYGLMRQYVSEALTMWEPRIAVREINVMPTHAAGVVEIDIVYEIKATKDERTLVFPFYVAGEEE
jgi:phage baseplate assembly protein W